MAIATKNANPKRFLLYDVNVTAALVRWNRKDVDSRKLDLRLLKLHVVCSMVGSCKFISSHFYIVRSSNIQ